jgi:hypothetical protein
MGSEESMPASRKIFLLSAAALACHIVALAFHLTIASNVIEFVSLRLFLGYRLYQRQCYWSNQSTTVPSSPHLPNSFLHDDGHNQVRQLSNQGDQDQNTVRFKCALLIRQRFRPPLGKGWVYHFFALCKLPALS